MKDMMFYDNIMVFGKKFGVVATQGNSEDLPAYKFSESTNMSLIHFIYFNTPLKVYKIVNIVYTFFLLSSVT